jgi:BTB/POZ domain/MATH domain
MDTNLQKLAIFLYFCTFDLEGNCPSQSMCISKLMPRHWSFFIGNAGVHTGESILMHEFGSQSIDWGYRDFISHRQLEKDFVTNDGFTIGVTIEDKLEIFQADYLGPLSHNLYENSAEGEVSIRCKNDKVVKADRLVLLQDPFFAALFRFKDSQATACAEMSESSSGSDQTANVNPNLIDLTDYSHDTVTHLIEFIYTGRTGVPNSTQQRCELYFLADYTTNQNVRNLLELQIVKIDFAPSLIMDLMICIRNRGKNLKLRELAVKYYCSNRPAIINHEGYACKYEEFVDGQLDVDLLKELVRW